MVFELIGFKVFKIAHFDGQLAIDVAQQVGSDENAIVFLVEAQKHGREERLQPLLQHLGTTVIVDGRPRSDGPRIVELPIERAHVVRLRRAVRLNRNLHAVGLRELAQMDILLKVFGLCIRIIPLDEIVDLARATGMFLVRCNHFGILAQLLPLRDFQQSLVIGIALVAVLAVEAAHLLAIDLVRQFAPPNAPIMHIAFGQTFGTAPAFRGRTRPIGSRAVKFFNYLRQKGFKESVIARLDGLVVFLAPIQRLLPAPVVVAFRNLVAAAPQGQ